MSLLCIIYRQWLFAVYLESVWGKRTFAGMELGLDVAINAKR